MAGFNYMKPMRTKSIQKTRLSTENYKPNLTSVSESGSWVSTYSSSLESAWLYYYEYQAATTTLIQEEKKLKEEDIEDSLISHLTSSLFRSAYRSATSSHLYGCLAMEGFLNFYGVKRFGQEFYERYVKMLTVTAKLQKIFELCFSDQPSQALVKSIQVTFRARNNLVHPTTHETNSSNVKGFINPHPSVHFVNTTIATLELFTDEFCSADAGIARKLYFRQPC